MTDAAVETALFDQACQSVMILSKGKEMRRLLLAPLFAAIATFAVAAPMSKEQLSTPPAGARHYTISSTAGKHGDIWSWTRPDGRVAYRMSMSLRGWVTEQDELVTVGSDRRPTAIAIRGYTDQGDATEDFSVDGAALRTGKRLSIPAPRPSAADATIPTAAHGLPVRWMSRRLSPRAIRGSTCCPAGMPASLSASLYRSMVRTGPRQSSWPSFEATALRPHQFGSTATIIFLAMPE